MPPTLKTRLGLLRLAGLAEALSSLALFVVAMPLKYLAGKPEAVRVIGMIHGVLFLIFALLLILAVRAGALRIKTALIAFVASLFPAGPFFTDHRLAAEDSPPK